MKKSFLGLIFWLTAITWNLNENVSAIPSSTQKSRRLVLPPRASRREVQRLIYLKHFLELNCLKQICNHAYCKYRAECQTPETIKQTSPIKYSRNQVNYYNSMREKKLKEPPQYKTRYFPDNKMIFIPPNVYFTIRRPPNQIKPNIPFHLGKISPNKNTKNLEQADAINQSTENVIYTQVSPHGGNSRSSKENITEENERTLINTDGMPKADKYKFSKPNSVKPTTASHPFLQPNQIRQYEVVEITDEKPTVKGNKNLKNFEFYSKKNTEKPISGEETRKKSGDDVKKTDIRNSTTVKTLMGKSNDTIISKYQSEFLPPMTTLNIKNLLNPLSPELIEGRSEGEIPKDQLKQLKITLPARTFHNRHQKIIGETTLGFEEIQYEPSVNFGNPERGSATDGVDSITESAKTSLTTTGMDTTPQQKTVAATPALHTEQFDSTENLNYLDFKADRKSTSVPAVTEVIQKTTVVGSRKPLASSVTSSEIQTTDREVSKGLKENITSKSTDFVDDATDNSLGTGWSVKAKDTSTTVFNIIKTVKYFSEATMNTADLTTPHFEEFTDHPLLFNLYPRSEPKDSETAWKNSRKMHFGESQKTTKTNQITNDPEQRRSDILITENADYFDYENNVSTSNYLEKLKMSGSVLSNDHQKNSTSPAIIPLIPLVINDLREGKFSPEDITILSDTFGKYWPFVLVLSNHTNIDMLPLMKMKDEKDLEEVLRNFLPENFQRPTTTKKVENDLNKNYYDLYDYMDNYNDFGLVQEDQKTHVNNESERFGNDESEAIR